MVYVGPSICLTPAIHAVLRMPPVLTRVRSPQVIVIGAAPRSCVTKHMLLISLFIDLSWEIPLLNTWTLRNGGRVSAAEGPRLTTLLSEVLEAALGVSLHGLAAGLPVGGADLAVLVGELEGLDETEGLGDVAADGQVVDGDLAQGALRVDDEETAQGDTLLLDQDAVVAGDLEVLVGDQGQLQVLTKTTLLAGALAPCQVGEVAVGGDTEDGGVELLELGEGVVEGEDLSGADKGEVHGVEQENDPMSEVSERPCEVKGPAGWQSDRALAILPCDQGSRP